MPLKTYKSNLHLTHLRIVSLIPIIFFRITYIMICLLSCINLYSLSTEIIYQIYVEQVKNFYMKGEIKYIKFYSV